MPRRVVLAEIDVNHTPRHEYSTELKQRILGLHEAGISGAKIAVQLGVSKPGVNKLISRTKERGTAKNNLRSGRPSRVDYRERHRLEIYARRKPLQTYFQLMNEVDFAFCRSTLRRVLKAQGVHNWRAKRRPALSEKHAHDRLEFALNHRDTDWSTWLFSDECSVELYKGQKGVAWAFGSPREAYQKDHVFPYPKKNKAIMVWGVIGHGVAGFHVIELDRIHGRYITAQRYTDVLEIELLPYYIGQTFQQDNAKVHTAFHTQRWFETNRITVSEWPSCSPDLNPIEHMWPRLKELIYRLEPSLIEYPPRAGHFDLFRSTIPRAWDAISQETRNSILESMPRRVEAVIEACGWYTRY